MQLPSLSTPLQTSDVRWNLQRIPSTSLTVVRSWWLEIVALSTPPLPLRCLGVILRQFLPPVLWYASGICQAGSPVADEDAGHECVEEVGVSFSQGTGFNVAEQPLGGIG